MAFIEKDDPVILNIKLTDIGRRKLSEGNLQFKKICIGDSEIDYKYIRNNNISGDKISIFRPMDKNPNIISFIKENNISENKFDINSLTSKPYTVDNESKNRGFFKNYTDDGCEIIVDPNYIRQADCKINIRDVIGGYDLRIRKSSTYSTNVREPQIGDYLMIKWTNPNYINNNNLNIVFEKKHPILFYRINEIVSGTLFNDNLIVRVDRNLPNFTGYNGDNEALVIVYPPRLLNDYTYTTDFINDAVFSFIENYNVPTQDIPFWNLSLIFTRDIDGVGITNKLFKDSKAVNYVGFVSYIQNQSKIKDALGIIHYTNQSPANDYGEGFYLNTAKLRIPYIMWHKNNKMGLTLSGIGNSKNLEGLNISYRDLADENGNIVGKVFNGLKIFVIEDEELLFALSYKSNRNWTLPNFNLNINANINYGCPDCGLSVDFNVTQPINLGEFGRLNINNIIVTSQPTNIITILTNLNTNISNSKTILIDNSGIEVVYDGLISGDYNIKVFDLSSSNCMEEYNFTINNIQSDLSLNDVEMEQINSFEFTINTNLGTGSSFDLPLKFGYNYNFNIDWGDGMNTNITSYDDINKLHTYSSHGTYQIKINGLCESWCFNYAGDKNKLISINKFGNTGFIDMSNAFRGCSNLTTISDTDGNWCSKVSNMTTMFKQCLSLTSLDVSNWDVNSVTDMSGMFGECKSLTSLDVSNWDVGKVNKLNEMFNYCTSLTSLDVSNWDISSVTNMQYMFYNCTSLTSLDVSLWNVSSVTNMQFMFNGCSSLTSLDVSLWDVSSVTNMNYMFNNCTSLTSLDVSLWDVSSVTGMGYMFQGVTLDTTSYDNLLVGWSTLSAGETKIPTDIQFDGGNSKFTSAGQAAKTILEGTYNWSISDKGLIN